MATQQTISWIALPNGRLPNGDYRLSVFVSPRLSASSASATLNDFPDFVDWPKRLRQLTLRIGNRVGTSNSFGDFTTSFPKSEYWTALFPPSTRVRSFRFADRTSSPIVSYPVGPLLDEVNGQYGELASRFPDDLPSHEQMADPETGLQTPSLAVLARGRSRDELLAEAAGLIAQHQPLPYSSPAREVVQALLFQRPRFRTARAPTPPDIEFHDIVSALGQFPMLLRRVGLVLDFSIPATTFFPTGNPVSPCRVWVEPKPWQTPTATRHVIPYTWWVSPFQPSPRTPGSDLVDGYLRLGDPRFRVVQLDLDGAVAQLATMADALAAYTADPVGHGPPGTGLPALRSAGIAVARDARAGELAKALDRSKSLDGQIPTSATVRIELFAEDLVRGYRPLVLQVGETVIGAPCRRRERHNLTGADPDHQFVDDEAHAWVSSGPTQSDRTPPELYMQEVLLRWEGWALSVPRPGKWIAPDATGHESPTEQRPRPDSRIALESRMSAIPGTQPRLRFGARYAVAVTVADLAGNEPPESRFGDPAVTADLTYLRYEPVSPPTVVLTQPIGPMTTPGEAVDRLVVRTDNRDPDSADTISNDRSERHLAPPSTSQAMAETHGKFDEFDDEDAYRLIVSRERAFPVSSGATDDPIVPPTQLVNGSLPLPYLPEPIATGITLTQLPGMYEGEIGEATDGGLDYRLPDVGERPPVPLIMIDTGNPASWADPKSVRIGLVPGDGKPSWDPKTRVLSINVPVGMTRTIRYSSRASSDIHLLAVYQLATDGSTGEQLARLERAADQGRHWMLTPYRELTLVHACRRPVVLPVCENLAVRRSPGKTQGLVAGTVTFDLPSTGELMLEAVTEEWVDAGEDPDRFSLRSMPVGRYHVTPPSTTKKIDREFKLSLVPNPGARPPFVHEFGDTKYRRVRYRAIAISRYAEYFPSGTADLTRTSDIFNVDVPATTTPDPPRVRSVVPTLTWKTSDGVVGGNRVLTSTRRGNTVRVQLNRPWYSSGGGEQLAVVTEPSPFDGAAQLDSVVTRFGNDPIWRSRAAGELKPSGRYFPLATDTAKRVPLTAHGGTVVGFAAHDVRFDRDSDCWLADVELRSNGTENDVEYLPFVRLAFARYQKHALTGSGFDLRLSDVVMADPIQLLPTRTVQVTIKPSNPNLARVTVNGPVYWGRAGDSGGELTTSSVLTVEMQRRVDAIDDDVLGWEMVSTPITAEPVPSHPQVGPGMPVLWKGSITIPADGQFRVLVREFEEHAADSGNLATPVRTVRRLVYADAITLPT